MARATAKAAVMTAFNQPVVVQDLPLPDRLADAVLSLIELYEKTGRTDNAAEWKSRQTEGKP